MVEFISKLSTCRLTPEFELEQSRIGKLFKMFGNPQPDNKDQELQMIKILFHSMIYVPEVRAIMLKPKYQAVSDMYEISTMHFTCELLKCKTFEPTIEALLEYDCMEDWVICNRIRDFIRTDIGWYHLIRLVHYIGSERAKTYIETVPIITRLDINLISGTDILKIINEEFDKVIKLEAEITIAKIKPGSMPIPESVTDAELERRINKRIIELDEDLSQTKCNQLCEKLVAAKLELNMLQRMTECAEATCTNTGTEAQLPCGHVFCNDCSTGMNICRVCKATIYALVQVFQ